MKFFLQENYLQTYKNYLIEKKKRTQMSKDEQRLLSRSFQADGFIYEIKPKNQNDFKLELKVKDSMTKKELFKKELAPDDFKKELSFILDNVEHEIGFIETKITNDTLKGYLKDEFETVNPELSEVNKVLMEKKQEYFKNDIVLDAGEKKETFFTEEIKKKEAELSEEPKEGINVEVIEERTKALKKELSVIKTENFDLKEINKQLKKHIESLQIYVQDLETQNTLSKEEYSSKTTLLNLTIKAKAIKHDIGTKKSEIRAVDVALEDKDYYSEIDPEIVNEMITNLEPDSNEFARLSIVYNDEISKEALLPEQMADLEKLCASGVIYEKEDCFRIYGLDDDTRLNKNILLQNLTEEPSVVNFIKEKRSQIDSNIKQKDSNQKLSQTHKNNYRNNYQNTNQGSSNANTFR